MKLSNKNSVFFVCSRIGDWQETVSAARGELPESTSDHIRPQFEIAYQLVFQSRQTPGLNIR